MSKGINREILPKLIFKGMTSAVRSWDDLHGTLADFAPEYWFTVTVAQTLQKNLDCNKNWIGLEASVKQLIKDSRLEKPNKTTNKIRNGKCDLVVSRANEKPFAAIEIKSKVYSTTKPVKDDIIRLRDLLKSKNKNSLTIACLAIYTSANTRTIVNQRFDKNLSAAKSLCGKYFKVDDDGARKSYIQEIDNKVNIFWGVQCIYIIRS